jgi:CDP-diacylglycerol--glycerol-3-phosphate 3-phosphatidyltransferase
MENGSTETHQANPLGWANRKRNTMTLLKNLPMQITWMRVILIPVFMLVYYGPWFEPSDAKFYAGLIFVFAAITDYLDGYLARRWDASTPFGAFLDPVADKLIVTLALLMIIVSYQELWITLCAMLIIGREIVISALREWMANQQLSDVMSVSWMGKWKTAFQLVAIGSLLSEVPFWIAVGIPTLIIATLFTILSMLDYFRGAYRAVQAAKNAQS